MRPRINDVLIRLGNWPEVSGAKALSGDLRGNWRIRTGDFRVLFRVEEDVVSVVVVWKVGNRRDVYDDERGSEMNSITLEGKTYALVPMEEYELLMAGAPALPPADKEGNRPAVAFVEASIARDLVKMRTSLGLTQKAMADLAGIRVEVLNRAERGAVVPTVRTLQKIEAAFHRASKASNRRKRTA
jgi:mRNA interferase RelE/StbE